MISLKKIQFLLFYSENAKGCKKFSEIPCFAKSKNSKQKSPASSRGMMFVCGLAVDGLNLVRFVFGDNAAEHNNKSDVRDKYNDC